MSNKEIKENFLRLKLLKDSIITFENDIGSTLEDAAAIVDFLKELKSARPTVKIRPIQFQIIQKEHKGEAGKWNAYQDFDRDLKIIDMGKQVGVPFELTEFCRTDTPYFVAFETIQWWSAKRPQISLLECVAAKTMKRFNCSLEEVYSDSSKWDDPALFEILSILHYHQNLFPYAMHRWKNKLLSIAKID